MKALKKFMYNMEGVKITGEHKEGKIFILAHYRKEADSIKNEYCKYSKSYFTGEFIEEIKLTKSEKAVLNEEFYKKQLAHIENLKESFKVKYGGVNYDN